jgi:hypothetical protein
MDHAKAAYVLDMERPGAHVARERIYEAAERAMQPVLNEYLESILCPCQNSH